MFQLINTFTPASFTPANNWTPTASLLILGVFLGAVAIAIGSITLDARVSGRLKTAVAGFVVTVILAAGGLVSVAGALTVDDNQSEANKIGAAAVTRHNTVGAAEWLEHKYGITATPTATAVLVSGGSLVVDFRGSQMSVKFGDSAAGGKVLVDDMRTPLPQK